MDARTGGPIGWPVVRQRARLAIGVGGTGAGLILLSSNLLGALAAGTLHLPWVSLLANAGLMFGGVMFLREYRRTR